MDFDTLESQIGQWRGYVEGRRAIANADVDELEDHLRTEIARLATTGLSPDEAFLVAVKRMGNLDDLSREFAREHSDRLWKQLVLSQDTEGEPDKNAFGVMAAFAVAAALVVKAPEALGFDLADNSSFYFRNLGWMVLGVLAAYFAVLRHIRGRGLVLLAAPFVAAAVLINLYPFEPEGSTEILAGLHLAVALWLMVGVAYLGGDWSTGKRMDYVRFTGEWLIYYVLIGFGGGLLIGMLVATFETMGIDAASFVERWLLPCGAAGAVIVASWLVEAKQSVIENMAPVLTKVFTPLFAGLFLASLGALVWTGNGINVDRDVLILFDFLLVVVLGLELYSISARESDSVATVADYLLLVLIVSALILDLVALAAISSRISDFGFTPNRTAGLGLNLVLLANLSRSAWLSIRSVGNRASFAELERWQTSYIPIYLFWASTVVVVLPLAFGFA